MATINSKIEGVDVLGVVTAGETIYVGRATSAQHGIVKPAATDFLFDSQTNALLVKLGVGLKRTADGIAIAIYDGSVVTDILVVEGGLEIKYADIDEGTENSKVIPWSEFTADEIEYLKKYFNIEHGTGEGAVQQVGAKATGPHSAAFGSRRYDKPTDESRRITEAKGGNAFAAGGSVTADGDFTAAFGKETQAEQSASFAAGTKTQAGKTLEEYIAAGGKAEDYAKSYAAAAVFGDGNKAKGYADFAAGTANESDGTSNTTVGGANKVKGTRNFTGGEANEVGQSGSSDVGNALTFGQHLKNTGRWNRVTFGQFNADDLAALFEIGNGTSDTNRVNIFVIKDNGAVYTGKLGKIHQGTRFQVSDGNSESDRRALIDTRHNGVTHIESYTSTLNGSVGNGNKVASSESGELKDIADPTDGNYPSLNTFLAGQGLQNKGRFNQVIVGQFNEFDTSALFQVGTGESDTNRKKGFRVDYVGRAKSDTAAAGDDFYVRVADLGENVVFPYGEHSIDYDATKNGLTITGTMRIYVKKTASDDTSVYHDIPNVSMSVPIKAGNNMIIDKAADGDWLVVGADIPYSSSTPFMDGVGSVGSANTVARGDHRHPSDTSRQEKLVSGTNIKTINGQSVLGSGDISISGGGTIDADTLNRLLSGSNGIDIAKNTAGDKVEVKIGEEFTSTGFIMHASNGKYTTIKPTQIVVQANDAKYQEYIETDGKKIHHYEITGFNQGVPTAVDSVYLHQDNVKTLFGNQQSIYGTGNIDLYRHNLYIHFEHKSSSGTRQIQMYVQLISSSNTNIDSLIDLFSMFSNIKDIPASGTVTGGLGQNGVCVSVTEFSMSGKITAMLVDGGGAQYDISNATLHSIRDTVTTV